MGTDRSEWRARLARLEAGLDRGAWVRAWKKVHPGRRALGILPGRFPVELVHASGVLPVLWVGGDLGDRRGTVGAQSYPCPWSVRLGVGRREGGLGVFDGLAGTGPCDVLRNLVGAWELRRPGSWACYWEPPLASGGKVRRAFARERVRRLVADLGAWSGRAANAVRLRRSIRLYNRLRAGVAELYRRRAAAPRRWPAAEVYRIVRAAGALPPEAYVDFLEDVLRSGGSTGRAGGDPARVLVTGLFCEPPPLEFFEILDRVGCAVVWDDIAVGPAGWGGAIAETGDPFEAVVRAYARVEGPLAWAPDAQGRKVRRWVRRALRLRVDGVLLVAVAFCDPALLEEPALVSALQEAGLPWISLRLAPGGMSLRVLQEQAEAFADAIRLRGCGF